MKKLIAIVLLVTAPCLSTAKCAGDAFVFSGIVLDSSGKPVMGSIVGISWAENHRPTGPALALTNAHGRFKLPITFDTYSGKGKVVEDLCNARVTEISVSALKDTKRSPYQLLSLPIYDSTSRLKSQKRVKLPALKLFVDQETKFFINVLESPGS
jgi:hypothetical protein